MTQTTSLGIRDGVFIEGGSAVGSLRRLAAILSADLKDSCLLMGRDEEGTFERMKRYRRHIIEPAIVEHRGRVVRNTGDGFLAIFNRPCEAVRCAIAIQENLVECNASLPKKKKMQYRIGVNFGDVIVDADDIYGDGVNVAARVQSVAEPDTVYISGGVYEQVKNRLVCAYYSFGDQRLKNITEPVRIYRVLPGPEAVAQAKRPNRITTVVMAAVLVAAVLGGSYAMRATTFAQVEERGAISVPVAVTYPKSAPNSENVRNSHRPARSEGRFQLEMIEPVH
jgi:class 3 adenylate cyclase